MLNPRLDLYRIFQAAAEAGSYTEAAARLFMTQSAVSQAMAQLEQQLQAPLFYRIGRGMALTAEGELLQEHLAAAFEAIRAGEAAVSARMGLEAGALHIAASDTLCRHYLLPRLQAFHEAWPDIRIQVTNRPSPACLAMIHRREADVAFVNRSAYPPPPGVLLQEVLTYGDVFVAGEAFRSLAREPVTLEALLEQPLILLEQGSSTRENLEAWASGAGHPLTPAIEAGSVDVILDLVRIGLGIGWVPGYAVPSGTGAGLWPLRTTEAPPPRQVAMASLQGPGISAALRAFQTIILQP